MSSGRVFLALLAGVAAGAVLGVLFAPDKGKVTREKISKKGEDYVEGLREKINEFVSELKDNATVNDSAKQKSQDESEQKIKPETA